MLWPIAFLHVYHYPLFKSIKRVIPRYLCEQTWAHSYMQHTHTHTNQHFSLFLPLCLQKLISKYFINKYMTCTQVKIDWSFIKEQMYKIKETRDGRNRFSQGFFKVTSLIHKANLVIIMSHIRTACPSFHKFLNHLSIQSS